ncbi:MAG TPA: DUF2304 family protein [Geothermobacteraceae bacterium]|nr:DUF2304 family protein [Geothermobacteraceae bacterium]
MPDYFIIDRIQFFSILFSGFIFWFIFWLVKHKKVKEEYSLLWFATSLVFLYLSLDRHAVDRLGDLFGIAYKPTIILLIIIGFITLVLVHITVVITRISEQNKVLIQELGLTNLNRKRPFIPAALASRNSDILVIVPAFNEAENIRGVINDLKRLELDPDILVVNDGSSDGTYQAAKKTRHALVLNLPTNLGIGGAVQTGFKWADRNGYRIAIQFDGDGQHLAEEVPKLLARLEQDGVNMVIGSRFLEKHAGYRSTFIRRQGIRLFKGLNSLLIGQLITDNTSGFRAYDRRAIEFLARHYPVDYPEPEAVILLGRNNFSMAEVATEMQERQGGGSSIAGLKGGYYMIKVILAVLMTALRKPIPGRGK